MPTQEAVTLDRTSAASTLPLADTLERGLGGMLFQMGGAVVVVVALILVLQRLARRAHPGWGGRGREGGIEVLSQRPLGKGLSLVVVRTHGQTLLLGTSPQGVTPVATLGPEETPPRTDAAGELGATRSSTQAPSAPSPAPTASPTRGPVPAPAASPTRGPVPQPTAGTIRGPVPAQAPAPAPVPVPVEASRGGDLPGRARGVLRSLAARAVARRPENVRRSGLADLEEAARIASEARARDEALVRSGGGSPDLQTFETEFRAKLRAIQEKYETLDEVERRRA